MKKTENGSKYEIERRFLVKQIPDNIYKGIELCRFRKLLIHQGYLADERGSRLRDESEQGIHEYFLTWKEGEGVKRLEHESKISRENFIAGFDFVLFQLWKTRYLIPHAERSIIELNFFQGKLDGYVQIEVEFESLEKANAFVVPCWFGEEVTDDKRHGNYNLARDGVPKT